MQQYVGWVYRIATALEADIENQNYVIEKQLDLHSGLAERGEKGIERY
jgi:hypothetical protein